jgi:hypothetical protein
MQVYNPPLDFFEMLSLYSPQALLKGKFSFCAVFILSAHSENTWKVFKRLWGMRGKYLSAFGDYAGSI